jgi:hypothetical protein
VYSAPYTYSGGASYDYRGFVTVHDTSGLSGTTTDADADWYLVGTTFGSYGQEVGASVGGGDLDGDGYDDLVTGAAYYSTSYTGAMYVVRGASSLGTVSTTIDSVYDARVLGGTYDYFGIGGGPVVADFDGDADADVAMGAYWSSEAYVFFGAGTLSGSSTVGASADVTIDSSSSDYLGTALAAGDFDDDGLDDLAIGAPYDFSGTSYVSIFGGADMIAGTYAPSDASAEITGAGSYDYFGARLLAPDLDGDGTEDLVVSASYAASYYGRVYFVGGL